LHVSKMISTNLPSTLIDTIVYKCIIIDYDIGFD